jgi:predicted transcriptional regulator
MPRRLLQDERISYRAAGVLTHLLSLPNDWRTNADKLAAPRKEGRDAVETALRELEAVGYLARRRVQYKTGQWGWVWLSGDDPEFVAVAMLDELRDMASELHPTWVRQHLGDAQTGHLRAVE